MVLEGDVKSDDLVNLLQVLTLQRRMGVLCLRSQQTGRSNRILIGESGVAVEGGGDLCYPGLLVSEGLVPAVDIEAAIRECPSGSDLILAIRSSPSCAKHIDAWRRACRRERLLAVFESGPARFILEEHEIPTTADLMPVDFIVLEAARREDEARSGRRLPATSVLQGFESSGLTPIEDWVLRALDGTRTVCDVATELCLPLAIVLETASKLVGAGHARQLGTLEIVQVLRGPDARMTDDRRASLWLEVVRDRNCPADLIHEAASSCASAGRILDAVTCWRIAASEYRRVRDLPSAARCLLAAQELSGGCPRLLARALRLAADARIPEHELTHAVELAVRLARTLDAAGGGDLAYLLLAAVCCAIPERRAVLIETSTLAIRHRLGNRVIRALERQLSLEEASGLLGEAVETAALLVEHDQVRRRDRQIKLNVLRVRFAFSKRVAEGRRVIRRGSIVGLAVALGWTTWAYRGEASLVDLNRDTVTPEQLRSAAGTYFLVPAGFELRQRARELEANVVSSRESTQVRDAASAEADEVKTRLAKECLERARFSLGQGDLEFAAKEYRAAASYDSSTKAIASKELADVERELRDGTALIRAANTAESMKLPKEAHALRLRALAQHPNVPAVRTLSFNIRLIADPSDRITVQGQDGNGTLDFVWDQHRDITVFVEGADGKHRASTLRWPPSSTDIPMFHEPATLRKIDVGGGIAFISPLADNTGVLLTLRSGGLVRLDEGVGEVARFVPTSLESLRTAALDSGDYAVTLSSSGRGRILRISDLKAIGSFSVPGEPRSIFRAPDGFWVMTSDDLFKVTGAGSVSRVGDALRGLRDMTSDGGVIVGVPSGGGIVEVALPEGRKGAVRFAGEDVRYVGCGIVATHGSDGWWTLVDATGLAIGCLEPSRSQFLVLRSSIVLARPDGVVEFLTRH